MGDSLSYLDNLLVIMYSDTLLTDRKSVEKLQRLVCMGVRSQNIE